MIQHVYNNHWISQHDPSCVVTALKNAIVIYMFICYNSHIPFKKINKKNLQSSLVSVWFTAAGRSLSCWVCVLKWAFHSVSFLVWCHCGLPRGRVAPLDWWCWRHICTSRDSVTFLGSFHEPCRAVFTVLPMSPGNVYGYFNTRLFLLLTVRLCIYIYFIMCSMMSGHPMTL